MSKLLKISKFIIETVSSFLKIAYSFLVEPKII